MRILLKKYRIRFWMYTLGPALLGYLAAFNAITSINWYEVLLGVVFVGVMYNIFIYGVNDYFDFEIDQNNPKKSGYEVLGKEKNHIEFLVISLVTLFSGVGLSLYITNKWVITLLWLSIFFGYFYSAPPIRFKELPILDSLSNILYTLPGVAVYVYYTQSFPSLALWFVVLFWPAAMHLFSAVIDYESDLGDRVITTAVWFGKWKAVWLCLMYWGFVSLLLFVSNLYLFGVISLIYPFMMVYILYRREVNLFKLYTYFPWINMTVGMLVTLLMVYRLW